ncbi:efflux RND transporter periplasmic adaptor subunit [Magnetospirillum molischianum]|uniref:Heavy metal RND efflux membrane fusion protein, CzcB family n=1 Tax=Magnetospirillum molischianum DSM 120 TaxID=1150626 RepID=H8FP01_MAGML|nr:efflux RND transporter periplasmic adaptor subunit [Magnetospirillum molischianum]CCG40089.1 Heavy metal RND efflux membrane fusion protein, CzcB family [Magnetospirillum molischianum DSM 120]
MKQPSPFVIGGIAVLAALGGGYWIGRSSHGDVQPPVATGRTMERQILFYQNPDATPDYSPVPKRDVQGRDYTPVYADPDPNPVPATKPQEHGKILYYRNPMGLPDRSPVPKQDSMGMDYVPVYEGDDNGTTIRISPEKVQKLGVRTETARMNTLTRSVRAVGSVQIDERNLHVVTAKFEGYIERLHVNQTGQMVRRGQPLMEVYSPDLVLAEQEYQVAMTGAQALNQASRDAQESARSLAEGALTRLRNLDVSAAQIERLRQGGAASRTLTLAAPASGIVVEKRAIQGMRFMPGEMLYQIADLSRIWVVADVFEQDLAQVRVGLTAKASFDALPGSSFTGKVTFISPFVTPETRTVKVRIELLNPDGRLKPALYGTVDLASPVADRPVLTIPDSAILDSGTRQTVLVERGDGLYEPREVKVGTRAGGLIEVRDGVAEGEKVVVRANFLIDAESNLRAALQSFHSH